MDVCARACPCAAWSVLWSQERKRQRAFMIFGLELILQLDVATTRQFFTTFFRLPPWYDPRLRSPTGPLPLPGRTLALDPLLDLCPSLVGPSP